MHVPIDPKREYRPKEIYERGFILNTVGKRNYRYILELIKSGRLRARNAGTKPGYPYWKVLGADIITWKKGTYNIDKQEPHKRKFHEGYPFPQPPTVA